jgi:polyhydroxyalkanoate synthesis regulator phasin
MDEAQKQIIEQVAALAMATADTTCSLVEQLVKAGKLDAEEALLILNGLAERHKELAARNSQRPGMAEVFSQISNRIGTHSNRIELKIWAKQGDR